jgi:hypothetical protein
VTRDTPQARYATSGIDVNDVDAVLVAPSALPCVDRLGAIIGRARDPDRIERFAFLGPEGLNPC